MMIVMWILIGYAVGVIHSVIVFRPSKEWETGYEAARNLFSDWKKGFDTGYDAAADHYQDYKQGFYDGWRECEKKSAGEGEV